MRVYVAAVVPTTLLIALPEADFDPAQTDPPDPPDFVAVHGVVFPDPVLAFVDDHVRYVVPPGVTEVGLAVIVTVGASTV
jgi:hypothetical protein